jgi:hypothetical protein
METFADFSQVLLGEKSRDLLTVGCKMQSEVTGEGEDESKFKTSRNFGALILVSAPLDNFDFASSARSWMSFINLSISAITVARTIPHAMIP